MATAYEFIGDSSNRAEWLNARLKFVGASDSPYLFGEGNPRYGSPYKIAAQKQGLLPIDESDSPLTEYARMQEPVMIDYWSRHNKQGRHGEPDGRLLRSKRWPWMSATLDGMHTDGKRGAIECKWPRFSSHHWHDGVPEGVVIQAQHQLAVTGLEFTTVIAALHGYDPHWADVERDDDFIENKLVPATKKFDDMVKSGGLPPVDSSEATQEAINAMFSPEENLVIGLGPEFVKLHDERVRLLAQKSMDEERLTAIRSQFLVAMRAKLHPVPGDAAKAVLPNGVTYRARIVKGGAEVRYIRKPYLSFREVKSDDA